jgi:hypothetical protein
VDFVPLERGGQKVRVHAVYTISWCCVEGLFVKSDRVLHPEEVYHSLGVLDFKFFIVCLFEIEVLLDCFQVILANHPCFEQVFFTLFARHKAVINKLVFTCSIANHCFLAELLLFVFSDANVVSIFVEPEIGSAVLFDIRFFGDV